jgi:DNA helicase IV
MGSMTLVGDVAQSTTPAGQERWSDVLGGLATGSPRGRGSVADLTIGYRVPAPILSVANRLLPLTGVDATESRSVRNEGDPPTWHRADPERLGPAVAAVVLEVKSHHRLTGIVTPVGLHDRVRSALLEVDLTAVDHVHDLAATDVPLFSPEAVKGLEFDGVVVVNPHAILSEGSVVAITPRGARLLYVALTRAVQRLDFVTDADPPAILAP